MPNKREKQQAEERNQRRKEKRAKRHGSSSSGDNESEQDNSSHSARNNGVAKNGPPVDQARSLGLDDIKTSKLLTLSDTFQNLSDFVGVLQFLNLSAANAADVFRPEIELRAENERLQQTVNQIINAVETQQLQDLRQKCHRLEKEIAGLDGIKQQTERERQELVMERKAILIERQEMENEFKKRTESANKEFEKEMVRERNNWKANLASIEKSEKKTKDLNVQLKEESEKAKQTAQDLRVGNDTLMAETRRLISDLDKEKSRFCIQSHGIDYYQANFAELHQRLEELVFDCITGPMNDDQILAVEATSLEEQEFFKFVPTRNITVAQYLWRRGTQAFISSQLYSHIWQSFPCDHMGEFADPSSLKFAFDTMSRKYAQINPEREGIWRNMTHEILDGLCIQLLDREQPQRNLVSNTMKVLDPIIDPKKKDNFAMRLTEVISNATSLWSAVKTDSCRIVISTDPPNENKGGQKWRAASLKDIEMVTCLEDISIEHAHTLCLFPSITATEESGKDVVVYPGQALFADCVAFALGYHEKQETARELAQRERELRHSYRKSSVSSQSTFSIQNGSQISHRVSS
ncbi:hypothetical protein BGW36DRAFT_463357 [Talaromyces proteolyticus]|uniref:Uncharacterized protein n=1 Tax=Talaromyces proteolyticus TaxID=1131652 RepID=A0AAD4PVN1_9EURO|nr:uncharacterized protein BGW36DRAFT_463357 [Talaromyces proteolyticus]KAH8693697.1 hypothetical protein BGW36DRAFT_463357 [Talaromyces proteolyticus]